MQPIRIRGARTHNLKDVDLDLPRGRLIVITGPSGSGKSTLAFDTLYAEGQRRYVESLSTYARQFLSLMDKPDVDHIEGLSPAIAIQQRVGSRNPRSTVGTITEINHYLRLLFARAGVPRCPVHGDALEAHTIPQMVDAILSLPEGRRVMLLAPIPSDRDARVRLNELRADGYHRVLLDGEVLELAGVPQPAPGKNPKIDVVVDRFRVRHELRLRIAESLESCLRLSGGTVRVAPMDARETGDLVMSSSHSCPACGFHIGRIEPHLFSFNAPSGACQACNGIGVRQVFDPDRIVVHPERALTDGAIAEWDSPNGPGLERLADLARHYRFELERPFETLAPAVQHAILHGSGDECIDFSHRDSAGRQTPDAHPFEGVVRSLERRWRETTSEAVRQDLSRYLATRPCSQCAGTRLNDAARSVYVADATFPQVAAMSIGEAHGFLANVRLPGKRGPIATKIASEILVRLGFLRDLGLDYLTLHRGADSISGGEAQRIRLAGALGAGLVGVLYVLDEPSIGLHQRDNLRLLQILGRLRDMGNTVVVIEHDLETIQSADHVVDMGPGAGTQGGEVIAQGPPQVIATNPASLTGRYLTGELQIPLPPQDGRTPDNCNWLHVLGATGNNLKNIDAAIPLGLVTSVTGVSGSGKSTLVNDTLYRAAARRVHGLADPPAPHRAIEGLHHLDKVIRVDQRPIGRTPRSNPATYTGLLSHIRELFAATPEARSRGYMASRFSLNVKGGRCEACKGDGLIRIEMQFLPDMYVSCDSCGGARYNRETLEVRYKGLSIRDVLGMTVTDALQTFRNIPPLARKLHTLIGVGLPYLILGQSSTTLSGGEAQRLKLAKELSRQDTGRTLYLMDEPTTGLHLHDINQLLEALRRLRESGNTIVVIEHNLELICAADWIIDLGPEGGPEGGNIMAAGTPADLAGNPCSHTGRAIHKAFCSRYPIPQGRQAAGTQTDPPPERRRTGTPGSSP